MVDIGGEFRWWWFRLFRASGGYLGGSGLGGGGGGFFGNSEKIEALATSEQQLAKIAKTNDLEFSIVRTGNLKGGGPGDAVDEDGNPTDEKLIELGLQSL